MSRLDELRRGMALLRAAGWDVLGAPDAVEACVLLESYQPEVVFLDPRLPGADTVADRAGPGTEITGFEEEPI
jgi:DNA-binding response OmpR family regulator